MPQLFNLDFSNHNSQRAYPLVPNGARKDATGVFTLPDSFLINLSFPIPVSLELSPTKFFLYSLGVYSNGYTLTLGYNAAGGAIRAATATIPALSHTRYQAYTLSGIGDFAGCKGFVQIGDLADISEQPAGSFLFEADRVFIDPDCVQPMLTGVTSLTVINGTTRMTPLSGEVELVALQNFRLSVVQATGQNPKIQLSAIRGEGLNEECVCEGDSAPPPPITSINGIPPTPDGRFYVSGDSCFQFTGITNGIRVEDRCCTPCCGCPELAPITEDLEVLRQEITTIDQTAREARLQALNFSALMTTKLNDQGCFTCD